MSGKQRAVRASVSYSPDVYSTFADVAKPIEVSTSRIIPDTSEKYLAEQWPLFGKLQ